MDAIIIFGAKYLFILSVLIMSYIYLRSAKPKRSEMLIFFAISLPLSYLIALISRELYFNPRPFVVGNFTPLIPHKADNGFPSDHTLLVSAIASGAMFFNKRFAFILWIIAITVGLSRVLAGVHHLIDIVGSILISLFSAYVVHIFRARLKNGTIAE